MTNPHPNRTGKGKLDKQSETAKSEITADASGELTIEQLQEAWDAMLHNSQLDEVVLIAPTKKIKKIWEKDYPGIKVILRSEHKGYDLPKDWGKVT